MPTPCLNAFWHSDPYIFLHFVGNVFFRLVSVNFLGALIFSEDRQLHAAAANGELGLNSTRFSRLWRKQPQKSTPARRPTEKSVRSGAGDRLASFPGGKPRAS